MAAHTPPLLPRCARTDEIVQILYKYTVHGTHKGIFEKARGSTAKKVVHAPANVGQRRSIRVCFTRSSRSSPGAKRNPLPMCAVNSTPRPTCRKKKTNAARLEDVFFCFLFFSPVFLRPHMRCRSYSLEVTVSTELAGRVREALTSTGGSKSVVAEQHCVFAGARASPARTVVELLPKSAHQCWATLN